MMGKKFSVQIKIMIDRNVTVINTICSVSLNVKRVNNC